MKKQHLLKSIFQMKIELRKSAIKDLKNISEPFKNKIHHKILELQKFPNIQNIKKLTNFEPAYRLGVEIIEYYLM